MRATPSSFAAAALFVAIAAGSALAMPLDVPTIDVISSNRSSVTLEVGAGASGAPGGFIVEWMTLTDFQNGGGWTTVDGSDFVGTPTLHVTPGVADFRLDGGEAAQVVVGDLFDETGVSAADRDELQEGTQYVVRARAAAGGGFEESANTATLVCGTPVRPPTDCTLTQGFWKTHPESWTLVASITLGTVSYNQTQLLSIFGQPAKGNGLISLAHQLIAAKLNVLLGAVPPASIVTAISQADALIGALVVPPIGSGSLAPNSTSSLTDLLDAFNSGTVGVDHCPDGMHVVGTKSSTWGSLKMRYR